MAIENGLGASNMAIGGRPKEEGGHKPVRLSLDERTYKALEKIKEGGYNVSKFVEVALEPFVKSLDPGPACDTIEKLKSACEEARKKVVENIKSGDLNLGIAYSQLVRDICLPLEEKLRPYECLCNLDSSNVTNRHWSNELYRFVGVNRPRPFVEVVTSTVNKLITESPMERMKAGPMEPIEDGVKIIEAFCEELRICDERLRTLDEKLRAVR